MRHFKNKSLGKPHYGSVTAIGSVLLQMVAAISKNVYISEIKCDLTCPFGYFFTMALKYLHKEGKVNPSLGGGVRG